MTAMRALRATRTALVLLTVLGAAGPVRPAAVYTITTTVESGNGKIRPASLEIEEGGRRTLTAKPDPGWHVAQITLDGTLAYDKDDDIALAGVRVKGRIVKYTLADVMADHAVAVTFEANRSYDLTLSVDGAGAVKVRPGGVRCTADTAACGARYQEDRVAKLRAKPARGHVFAGWTGGTSGMRQQSTLVMNGNKTVTALFVPRSAPPAALKVAEKVSVVEPKGVPVEALRLGTLPALPPSSDYAQDETFTFVEEHSVAAFQIINEILCMTAQARYDTMLNRGPYKALVDRTLCARNRGDASGGGENAPSSGPQYMQWTVISTREDNGSPHVVKVWVLEEGDPHESPKTISARLVITESASETNPYGLFGIDFEAHPAPPETPARSAEELEGEPLFRGYLRTRRTATGDVLLEFISQDGGSRDRESMERATLDRNEAGGRGSTSIHYAFGQEIEDATYDVAFDADRFLRSNGAEQACLDRNDFAETGWRYGLYDSETGSRINPRSGFPVRVTTVHGWIGYWGMWFPEDVRVGHGDTVYKQGFRDEAEVAYQLFVANGRLRRHTRRLLTLAGVRSIPLDWWDDSERRNYRVAWDGTAFKKTARFNEATGTWEEVQPPVVMALTDLHQDTLFFWSPALGGNVRVKLECTSNGPPPAPPTFTCSAGDASPVTVYTETIVYPSDGTPASLACMSQCPNGANSDSGNLFFDDSQLQFQNTAPAGALYVAYAFDDDAMLLTVGGQPIVQTVEHPGHPWGVMSGPLFDPTTDNLAKLACDWDQSGGSTCGWQAWDRLDEYYTLESGPDQRNRFIALKNDGGGFERFEPPLAVRYIHHQTDPAAPDFKYDGTTFYLEYNGFGDLHGIPGRCVDRATGEAVGCGPDTRWIPELTIPDGAGLEGDDRTYLAKVLEKEQRMKEVDVAECSALHLVSYALPRIDDWRAPDIGPQPVVDGPPAVVGGVLQE